MADGTRIEWTNAPGFKGATWNVVTGCTLVSEGCRNCYAAELAATRLARHPSREGLTVRNAHGVAEFTGEVRFNHQWLDQPLRWKKPRMVFVCDHGDLFHEDVPDAWIDHAFAVMALCPQHIFIVLTKRPERMRDYLAQGENEDTDWYQRMGDHAVALTQSPCAVGCIEDDRWPLPNVWLGVSIEDQATADARIPVLLETPAAIRWISAEPLLGPVDLTSIEWPADRPRFPEIDDISDAFDVLRYETAKQGKIDWVVVGGESGKNARPMHPDWARSLRDQCAAAAAGPGLGSGVPFLFKQWGQHLPVGQVLPDFGKVHGATAVRPGRMRLHYGGSKNEPPQHAFAECGVAFTVTDDGRLAFSVGKKAAGRLLDGKIHDAWPEVAR